MNHFPLIRLPTFTDLRGVLTVLGSNQRREPDQGRDFLMVRPAISLQAPAGKDAR